MPPDPPRSLCLRLSFRKSVNTYPRSAPEKQSTVSAYEFGGGGGGGGEYDEVFSPVSLAPPPLWPSLTCAPQSERIGLLTGPQQMPTPQASFPLPNKPRWHNTETVTQVTPYFLRLFFSNYNIPGVLSPSPSVNGTSRAARSYGSISGMRSGSFQRSNSNSNLYIPGTTPPQLFSAGSGYQPSTLVEQNEG